MMDVETEDRDGATVVRLRGRLDLVAAKDLRAVLSRVIDGGARLVVIDLEPTEFIDSSGLGAVVAGLKSARQQGGDLRIAGVHDQVGVVLGLTNLDRVLHPYESVEAALAANG